jgi:hypothetical protein
MLLLADYRSLARIDSYEEAWLVAERWQRRSNLLASGDY